MFFLSQYFLNTFLEFVLSTVIGASFLQDVGMVLKLFIPHHYFFSSIISISVQEFQNFGENISLLPQPGIEPRIFYLGSCPLSQRYIETQHYFFSRYSDGLYNISTYFLSPIKRVIENVLNYLFSFVTKQLHFLVKVGRTFKVNLEENMQFKLYNDFFIIIITI